MSIIKHSPILLSEVVKQSNLIVGVKSIAPFEEKMPVKNNAAAPPFLKKGWQYRITSVLKNTTGLATLPATIEVPDESWRRSMSEHMEHHANGPARSYNVRQYETEVTMKTATILFLNHFQGMFELTAKDSFDSDNAQEKIEILMSSRKN